MSCHPNRSALDRALSTAQQALDAWLCVKPDLGSDNEFKHRTAYAALMQWHAAWSAAWSAAENETQRITRERRAWLDNLNARSR